MLCKLMWHIPFVLNVSTSFWQSSSGVMHCQTGDKCVKWHFCPKDDCHTIVETLPVYYHSKTTVI